MLRWCHSVWPNIAYIPAILSLGAGTHRIPQASLSLFIVASAEGNDSLSTRELQQRPQLRFPHIRNTHTVDVSTGVPRRGDILQKKSPFPSRRRIYGAHRTRE